MEEQWEQLHPFQRLWKLLKKKIKACLSAGSDKSYDSVKGGKNLKS